MPQGLPRKLRRVFILQAVLAALAVIACLYASTMVGRSVLASQWARSEADRFWVESAADPRVGPPWTSSVRGYFVPTGSDPAALGVPAEFLDAAPGLHRLQSSGGTQRLLVEDGPGGRLYIGATFLLLDGVGRWSLLFGSLLAAVAIAVVSWLSYRIARRLVLPVTVLASEVAGADLSHRQ